MVQENNNQRCMYCGESIEFGSNPADYIHYTNKDVYGKQFVCPFCDKFITQTNRYLSVVLESKKNNDKDKMILNLEKTLLHLKENMNELNNNYSGQV